MRRQQSKSVVFLTELLLALMIFSLCASTCARLFGWAHRISGDSSKLSQAVVAAQSGAEAFKRIPSPEGVANVLEGTVEEGICIVSYDEEWKTIGTQDAVYVMEIRFAEEGVLRGAAISVRDLSGGEIFALEARALRIGGG